MMKNLFSIGELSQHQNISRQTLIFYDKIGLFKPAYVDPSNGYRYYTSNQLDSLDTICIMKRIGFSLDEIKSHMKSYTIDNSIVALRNQLDVINSQIEELQMTKSRVEDRCRELEHIVSIKESAELVTIESARARCILLEEVSPPYSLEDVSLATKKCFVRSFGERLPIYFQSGAIIPYEKIQAEKYTEASFVFLPIEKVDGLSGIRELPAEKCVCSYHVGDYASIGVSYERILEYCQKNGVKIISDSYEFAVNDYLSTGDEKEYVTKIMFYIE